MPFSSRASRDYHQRQLTYKDRKKVLPIVFAVLGAMLVFNLLGAFNYKVSALRISLSISIGWPGYTSLIIPPIGNINAITHLSPLRFKIALDNIDLDILRSIISAHEQGAGEVVVKTIYAESRRIILFFALKLLLLAGIGGVLGVLVLGRRSFKRILTGFFIGVLLSGTLLGVAYFTYNIKAFEHPEYEGIVEAAPWMINLIQESLVKVDQLGEQVQALATNLYTAFQQIENLISIGNLEADLTVLHVSDIHNNPIAYDFAKQVISSFPVNFIIDTGDLTDWGTPLEAEIVKRIEELDVEYVFTTGNHESPDVIERLKSLDHVVFINNGEQVVHGLRIAGVGDLSAKDYSPQVAPINELADLARIINERYRDNQDLPDIFIVHNHRIATAIEPGIFPLVLFGHNHVQSTNIVAGTVYNNAGTTGAAGIRGLQSKEPIPFSLSLLYFSFNQETEKYELIAVDGIRVQGLTSSFLLERTFVSPDSRNKREHVENM